MARIRLGGQARRVSLTFLDCDGVVFDSNPMKRLGLAHALEGQPEDAVEELLAHFMRNGGQSRYELFQRFFNEMVEVDDPEAAVKAALEAFGAASRAGYDELAPLSGALEFTRAMGGNEAVAVVTGSDHDEIRDVFEAHKISDAFLDVRGSPTPKQALIEALIEAHGVTAERALLVGDGGQDFAVAQALGMPFVFLADFSDWTEGKRTVQRADNAWVASHWASLNSWVVPAPELSGAAQKELRGQGHNIEPIVQTGKHGLSDAVLDQLDAALDDHELVKLRIGKTHDDDKKAMANKIERNLGCVVLQSVGRVLLTYRPSARVAARDAARSKSSAKKKPTRKRR